MGKESKRMETEQQRKRERDNICYNTARSKK